MDRMLNLKITACAGCPYLYRQCQTWICRLIKVSIDPNEGISYKCPLPEYKASVQIYSGGKIKPGLGGLGGLPKGSDEP